MGKLTKIESGSEADLRRTIAGRAESRALFKSHL